MYLALLSCGKTDAKTLAKTSGIPRQAAYRTLGELQEMGIVERIIAMPQEYKAVPLQDGLSTIIAEKENEFAQNVKQAKDFLEKFEKQKTEEPLENEYAITVVAGKGTIMNRYRKAADKLIDNACVCSNLQRWMQVNLEIAENVEHALLRGVRYRVVLCNVNEETFFPEELKKILYHPNYQVKLISEHLKTNVCIFDGLEAFLRFYTLDSQADSPMIWTNHPSLLVGFQDHFENLWRNSEKTSVTTIGRQS